MITTNSGMYAKETLQKYVEEIDANLTKYWESELAADFGFNNKQKELVRDMLVHAKEHNLRKSKRLRGSFVKYGYLLGGAEADERLVKAEMAIELVHTALLMHDDFMDQDAVRRGQPTTHKYYESKPWGNPHFGEAMAVSIGDAVLCLGYELLQKSGFESGRIAMAMQQLLRGIANTAWGQAYDVTLEAMKQWEIDDVINLHKAKTAIYTYENPLFIGAHLANLQPEVFDVLHDYSMEGGVAFQLQDDILGVFGDEEKTGKSADSDLREGKCTALIKYAIDNGTKTQVADLQKAWGNRSAVKKDIKKAKLAIVESGSYEYSKNLAKEYAGRAAKSAERLRNYKLIPGAIDYIKGIAEYMVIREV